MINRSICTRLAAFCSFERPSKSVNPLVGLSEVSVTQVAPDSRNGLNVGCSEDYSILYFQLVNEKNDSSVSFQGLGPCVETPPATIVYSVVVLF